ncbi:MAG TPA: Dna2/Cas4 domain-containing protein [Dictyobacter sp.]|jgi:CRISPR-associated exonuclease Cas4|nr:Dna2/Cas4 domain-containing protein [Dictyobacter sp.]
MTISSILFPVGIGLLLLSSALFILMLNERKEQEQRLVEEYHHTHQLPMGELVYEDADQQGELLTSDQFPLAGKPTYVVKIPDSRLVPIEVKPIEINAMKPSSNDAIQIAAYCLILEDYSDEPPTHGILRYADREFTIDYTPALRRKVIRFLNEMAVCTEQYPPTLQKQKVTKCRSCIFQPLCPTGQQINKEKTAK